MRTTIHGTCLLATLAFIAVLSGCGSKPAIDNTSTDISGPPPTTAKHDEHQGPHHGHVIELGRSHLYHAELVENEKTSTVTIYMLDKDMKEMAIDQPTITMNLKFDGNSKTFQLSARDAKAGRASRFDSDDSALFEALHKHEATGKLRVTINGSSYSGEIEHHDHDKEHGEKHKH